MVLFSTHKHFLAAVLITGANHGFVKAAECSNSIEILYTFDEYMHLSLSYGSYQSVFGRMNKHQFILLRYELFKFVIFFRKRTLFDLKYLSIIYLASA
jgi:hypothetical protein